MSGTAVRQVPVRSDFRFWTEEKIRNIDTDQFRHVNNAVISSFLEAGRMEVFAAAEPKALLATAGDATLAVVRLEVDFHRELFYPGTASIGSRVVAVGRTSFTVRQGVFDGEVCAVSAVATCVLFDARARKSVPVPD